MASNGAKTQPLARGLVSVSEPRRWSQNPMTPSCGHWFDYRLAKRQETEMDG